MDIKKQYILEVASKVLIEKGFPKTSMQDIAQACNVSKATLYKLFVSKENLGLLVLFYMTEEMTAQVTRIMGERTMEPKKMLRQCIDVRMRQFAERSRLLEEIVYSLSREQKENYLPMINRNRAEVMQLFERLVMKAFQVETQTAAGELAISLRGIMRELVMICDSGMLQIEREEMLDFIMDALSAIERQRRDKEPLLTKEGLLRMYSISEEEDQVRAALRAKRLMQLVREHLAAYERTGSEEDFEKACGSMERLQELHKAQPQ